MKFVRLPDQAVGRNHRTGWPGVLSGLMELDSSEGIIFDDFVEASFSYQYRRTRIVPPYREPWIGIFHHPAPVGLNCFDQFGVDRIVRTAAWRESARHLQTAIFLSRDCADYASGFLQPGTRIIVLKHPIQFHSDEWCNLHQLLQFGWYLKDINAICRVRPIPGWRYYRLSPEVAHTPIKASFTVTEAPRLDEVAFDHVLETSVGFAHYHGVSASNTILDCMGRRSPILLNRLPASEEYLGKQYPFFYDDLQDAATILSDPMRVEAAHSYLRDLDLREYDLSGFTESIRSLAL